MTISPAFHNLPRDAQAAVLHLVALRMAPEAVDEINDFIDRALPGAGPWVVYRMTPGGLEPASEPMEHRHEAFSVLDNLRADTTILSYVVRSA